ncbi:hypothetical protein TNIN_267141 [Trichonephila inaurata madagascariensis]|uniref:Uncharacterized protein n=1 Tax=Trichonephila inaurata madagascariensis TaxID=2747483 RepID=A0A8X6IER3_9ARAC|nr:hypothetical protein TNIN_267141 [Trichonephila inaurata madagascariensis]
MKFFNFHSETEKEEKNQSSAAEHSLLIECEDFEWRDNCGMRSICHYSSRLKVGVVSSDITTPIYQRMLGKSHFSRLQRGGSKKGKNENPS